MYGSISNTRDEGSQGTQDSRVFWATRQPIPYLYHYYGLCIPPPKCPRLCKHTDQLPRPLLVPLALCPKLKKEPLRWLHC